jgi:hypothetical protein
MSQPPTVYHLHECYGLSRARISSVLEMHGKHELSVTPDRFIRGSDARCSDCSSVCVCLCDCVCVCVCVSLGVKTTQDGMSMPDCPDPAACGYEPIPVQCIDCMRGMPMPNCPHPDVCPDSAFPSNSASCMMQTVFETSGDVCVFLASWHVTSGGQWFALSGFS